MNLCFSQFPNQNRSVEMPPAADLIISRVTVSELEHRRRSAESQLRSTQLAAEDKTDDDVLSMLPPSERETSCEDLIPPTRILIMLLRQ